MVSLRKHWHVAHEHNLFGENRCLAYKLPDQNKPQSEWTMEEALAVDEERMRLQKINAQLNADIEKYKQQLVSSLNKNVLSSDQEQIAREVIAQSDASLQSTYEDKIFDKSQTPWTVRPEYRGSFADIKQKLEEAIKAKEEGEQKTQQEQAAAAQEDQKKKDEAQKQEQDEQLKKEKARQLSDRRGNMEAKMEELRAEALYEMTKGVADDLSTYSTKLTDPELLGRISPDDQKHWKEVGTVMKTQMERMKKWQEVAKFFAEWKAGNVSPQDFRSYVERNLDAAIIADPPKTPEEQEIQRQALQARKALLDSLTNMINASQGKDVSVLKDYEIPDVTNPDKWNEYNQSDRLTIVHLFMENDLLNHAMGDALRIIDEGTGKIFNAIHHDEEALEKEIETVEKGVYPKELPATRSYLKEILSLPQKVGIEFYSVYDFVDGVKLVVKSYKDAFEDRKHRKAALVATQFGKIIRYLPFGEDVNIVIERNLDSAEDEIKGKYLEYLKRRRPEFTELIGPEGEIALNMHDKNRTRAVLEYAASRGWLYDLDRTVDAKQKIVLGFPLEKLVPAEWNETRRLNYWMTLRSENAGGVDHEIKHGHELVRDNENTPFFIREISHELHHGNIWGAVGIAERAIERGLWAEVSPWLTTTFMRAMRENPEIRKYMGLTALDRIGGLSLYRSAFTLGQFKGDRKTLNLWLRRDDADLKKAGTLGKTIALIEEEIKEKSGLAFNTEEAKADLDHRVALVLAGHTLKLARGDVSLFEQRYEEYRNGPAITKQGDLSPGVEKEDPDYFTQICENIMAGQPVVAQIMARSGQGTFRNDIKTGFYTGHIISLYLDLKEKGKNKPEIDRAAENFRREMGEKMTHWLSEDPLGDARSPGLHRAVMRGDYRVENKPILNTLLLNGFMDVEVLMSAILKSENGQALADQILKENSVNIRKPDYYTELKEITAAQKGATQDQLADLNRRYEELAVKWRAAQRHDVTWSAKYRKAPIIEGQHGGTTPVPSNVAHQTP